VNSGIIAAEKKSIKKYLQWQFFSRYIMLFNFETTIDFDTTLNKERMLNLNVRYLVPLLLMSNGLREPGNFLKVKNMKFTTKVTNKFLSYMTCLVRIKMNILVKHQTMEAPEHPELSLRSAVSSFFLVLILFMVRRV
jgi:hypothetical protein